MIALRKANKLCYKLSKSQPQNVYTQVVRSTRKHSSETAPMLRGYETLTTSKWHHHLILTSNHTLDSFLQTQPQGAQTLQISHLETVFTKHSDSSKSRYSKIHGSRPPCTQKGVALSIQIISQHLIGFWKAKNNIYSILNAQLSPLKLQLTPPSQSQHTPKGRKKEREGST